MCFFKLKHGEYIDLYSVRRLATNLRTEIKNARIVFSKEIVDELIRLTEDFGMHLSMKITKDEYDKYFEEIVTVGDEKLADMFKIYHKKIVAEKYEEIEHILGEYLEFV